MFFNFFSQKSVGIDIADLSIEVAELQNAGSIKVLNLGRAFLEPGTVAGGRIQDEKKLQEALRNVLASAEPKQIAPRRAIFGIPESQVYIHVAKCQEGFGAKNKAEQRKFLEEEARKNIPLDSQDLLFSHKVMSGDEVLLVAASKSIIAEWQNFFRKLYIDIKIFDIETLAVFRNLNVSSTNLPLCLVDIGSYATNVAIFDTSGLRYSNSLGVGGQTLASAGHDFSLENEKDLLASLKAIQPILDEVKTALSYFGGRAKTVVFVGGTSSVPGVLKYFAENIDIPVMLGSSMLPVPEEAKSAYIEAIGLALRAWHNEDPAITP